MTTTQSGRSRARGAVLIVTVLLAGLGFAPPAPSGAAPVSAATTALAQWKKALDNRRTTPASWVAYGDSITEGQGSSTRAGRWIDRTTATLRTIYPTPDVPGGVGYLPGWYDVKAPDSPWRPYSARSGSVKDVSSGSLGLRTAQLAAGATQTYSVVATSVDLYYATGGGVLTYRVDGGTAHRVDTAGVRRTDNRIAVTFTRPGTHQIVVSASSGTVDFEGVTVFNGDRTKGIRLFDSAHVGYASGQFVDARKDLDPLLALIKPDLVTIELGANDYLKHAATPAALAANLRSEITDIRRVLAAKVPSIVIVLTYGMPVRTGTLAGWTAYAAAIRSVVDTDPTVGLLDFSTMGRAAPGGYFAADGVHPNDSGQAYMAQLAAAYLGAK